jgi:hypothetical protein
MEELDGPAGLVGLEMPHEMPLYPGPANQLRDLGLSLLDAILPKKILAGGVRLGDDLDGKRLADRDEVHILACAAGPESGSLDPLMDALQIVVDGAQGNPVRSDSCLAEPNSDAAVGGVDVRDTLRVAFDDAELAF